MCYIDAMRLKGLVLFVLLVAIAPASLPAFGQTTDLPTPKRSTPPLMTSSSASSQAAGGAAGKGDCNGGPCEDQQPRVVVTLPAPPPETWSWHDRIQWAANMMLAVVGYVGIMVALQVMRKIERQTVSSEAAAAAAALGAEAALLNAQAIHDSQRPWLLITVEPSPKIEDTFAIMATNRGRTPATIVSTAEGIEFAIDESYLPAIPVYGELRAPRVPIILLPGESTAIESFSRDEGKRICETEERFKRVANWEEKVFISGKVVYRDLIAPGDKQIHETTWCCWYIHGRQKSGLVLAGPPSYNMHT
jgi:hypothetical protein